MHRLEFLGWSAYFEAQLDPMADLGLAPGRIVEEQRGSYRVRNEHGLVYAELAGKLRHEAAEGSQGLPCVGDWVLMKDDSAGASRGQGVAIIQRVLARRTKFSRQAPGERTSEQIVASNIDTVFLVQSMNRDLNLRRLERYLALLWESGAEPAVVLSKADLAPDREEGVAAVERVARGVPVLVTSALEPDGLDALLPYLGPGRTVALVGSSGVGKSTIVNRLAGEERMRVQEIREDGRGRHTTTARQLVLLPGGAMLLDTPGMRTVLLWEGEEGLEQTFDDVVSLASGCRFRDCTHGSEPGCAVRTALESGALDAGRLRSYEKLQREARHQAMKSDARLRMAEARRWRRIHLENRRRPDKRKI